MTRYSAHFTHDELVCRCGCGKLVLQPGFIEELEALRVAYGAPMAPTSCCRCDLHNVAVDGHPRSLHLISNAYHGTDTCAIDVVRPAGDDLHRLIKIATARGWSIGDAKSFIHLDRRTQFLRMEPWAYRY